MVAHFDTSMLGHDGISPAAMGNGASPNAKLRGQTRGQSQTRVSRSSKNRSDGREGEEEGGSYGGQTWATARFGKGEAVGMSANAYWTCIDQPSGEGSSLLAAREAEGNVQIARSSSMDDRARIEGDDHVPQPPLWQSCSSGERAHRLSIDTSQASHVGTHRQTHPPPTTGHANTTSTPALPTGDRISACIPCRKRKIRCVPSGTSHMYDADGRNAGVCATCIKRRKECSWPELVSSSTTLAAGGKVGSACGQGGREKTPVVRSIRKTKRTKGEEEMGKRSTGRVGAEDVGDLMEGHNREAVMGPDVFGPQFTMLRHGPEQAVSEYGLPYMPAMTLRDPLESAPQTTLPSHFDVPYTTSSPLYTTKSSPSFMESPHSSQSFVSPLPTPLDPFFRDTNIVRMDNDMGGTAETYWPWLLEGNGAACNVSAAPWPDSALAFTLAIPPAALAFDQTPSSSQPAFSQHPSTTSQPSLYDPLSSGTYTCNAWIPNNPALVDYLETAEQS